MSNTPRFKQQILLQVDSSIERKEGKGNKEKS